MNVFVLLLVDLPGVCLEVSRGRLQDSDLSEGELRDHRGVDLQRAESQRRLSDQRPAGRRQRTRESRHPSRNV